MNQRNPGCECVQSCSSVRVTAAAAAAARGVLAVLHVFMLLVSFMPFLHLLHLLVFLMSRCAHPGRGTPILRDGAGVSSSREGWMRPSRSGGERVLVRSGVRDGCGLVHAGRIDGVGSRWVGWDGHGWICWVWRGRIGRIGRLSGWRSCVWRSLIWPHVGLLK